MTKSEAISLLKQSIFTGRYKDAVDIVVKTAESTVTFKNKWAFDSQMTCGYYHSGCKTKMTLPPDDAGAVYTYFRHQYRFCPDCGELMFIEEE